MDGIVIDEASLDRFYQLQLTKLHDVCQELASNTDLAICYKWLKIFGNASAEDKYARSCLVLLMYEQIELEGRIGKPFTDVRLCSCSLEEVLAEQDKLVQQNRNTHTEEEETLSTIVDEWRQKGGGHICEKRMLADENDVRTTSYESSVQHEPTSLAETLEVKRKASQPTKIVDVQPLNVKLQTRNLLKSIHNEAPPSLLNKPSPQPKRLPPILKLPSRWQETPTPRKEPQIQDMHKIWTNFSPQAPSSIVESATIHQASHRPPKPFTSTKNISSIRQNPSQQRGTTLPACKLTLPSFCNDSSRSRPPIRTSVSINSLKTFDSHKIYWTYARPDGKLPLFKPRRSRRPLDRQVGGCQSQTKIDSLSKKDDTQDCNLPEKDDCSLPKKDVTDLGSLYSIYMNVSQVVSTISDDDGIELPQKPLFVQNNCCLNQNCFCKNENLSVNSDLCQSSNLESQIPHKWTQDNEETSNITEHKPCELCRLYEEHEKLQKELKEVDMQILANQEINKRVEEEAKDCQNTKLFDEQKKKLLNKLLYNSRLATHKLKRWNGEDKFNFLMLIFKVFRYDEEFTAQVLESEQTFTDVLTKIMNSKLDQREKQVRARYYIRARGKYDRKKTKAENRLRMQVAVEQQHQQLRKLTYLTLIKRLYIDECLGKIKLSPSVLGLLEEEYQNFQKEEL